MYWQFDGTNCTIFSEVYKGHAKSGFTSGETDGPFDPTNVQDLDDYSCLNGYNRHFKLYQIILLFDAT